MARAIAAKDRHAKQLFGHPGVVGAGVGVEHGHTAIEVLTARGNVAGIPSSLDGVKVVALVSGRIRALSTTAVKARPYAKSASVNPASYFSRPVPIGVSTGRADQCAAGTIGARVTDGSTVYALSANHVYANDNNASVGDTIVQPGLYDSGKGPNQCVYSSAYDLGTLSKWVPIDFSGGDNTVDAAIAATDTSTLGDATPSDGYGTPSSTTTSATLGLPVQKYGRGSGLTHGTVCLLDLSLNVSYGSGMVAHFVHQIGVCNGGFSRPGDSGSLIVSDDSSKDAVGLLFAGGGRYTFANPIGDVLSDLRVSVDDS